MESVSENSFKVESPSNDILEDLAVASGLDRRYSQLTDMMVHQNAEFDERKYWTYGCNCLVLGKNLKIIQNVSKETSFG